jgi:hypothetical protein
VEPVLENSKNLLSLPGIKPQLLYHAVMLIAIAAGTQQNCILGVQTQNSVWIMELEII